jgi:hypothetical protein
MNHASMFTAHRTRHMLLGAALLSASLLARSLVAPDTHAAISGCRSDPVVTLSNGYVFDLSAVVSDTYDDVQLVSYTLHAPVGTRVTSEVDTSVLGPKDTFQFYADEPPNTYSAGTKVTTGTPQMPAAATTDLVSLTGTVLSTASASGQSPQTLWMNVSG